MAEDQSSQPSPQYLDDEFKQWLEAYMRKHHVPGISVAVIQGDKVESAGYGFARLPDIPATADTLYCTGSTTKAFIAALMGILIHDQSTGGRSNHKSKLDWSTPIADILGEDFVTTES